MANPLLRVRPAGSFIKGPLPPGCAMCEKGMKMVLFVTGVCHYKCFYCPISEERRFGAAAGKKGVPSPVWANEKQLAADDLAGIAAEARAINARGTGLTGGDPMYDPERTLRYIRFLKQEFGPKHHIHMYTQIPFDAKWLRPLAEAGLDEMRFHPPDETWVNPDAPENAHYKHLWLEAKKLEEEGLWKVGFEIPCIPGSVEQMSALVAWLAKHGFGFINVNEMEFSETNYAQLLARGYRIKDDITMRVMDSQAVAEEVIGRFKDAPISIHFCSSPFKDAIQLRQRLARRAANTKKAYEEATDDGTLLRGVIECPDPAALLAELHRGYGVPLEQMEAAGGQLRMAPAALEAVAKDLPYPAYVSEIYPTSTELEVERRPLNAFRAKGAVAPRAQPLVLAAQDGGLDRRVGRPGGL
ncbi:MAG TPA: radical SAM protein [Candidatus Thermoplasmatota archaeon]|nr:radical SAM protein [Candidatus Thermoplasmatota archaeon]